MTDVKRYTLVDGLLHTRSTNPNELLADHELFTGERQVVLATDYDALAAELAASENGFNNACARLAQLEAALREIADKKALVFPNRHTWKDARRIAEAALAAPDAGETR